MKSRNALIAAGTALILGAPLAALADVTWITTNDEAGSRIVTTRDDPATRNLPVTAKALNTGDVSTDRQYVFNGEEGGWQIRPMEYRYQEGRIAHVDDPVGHMDRLANSAPLTEQQRISLERSAGS